MHWFKPWDKAFEGNFPDFKFFIGGISNPCYNCLDRHLEKGFGNKVALIWEGENSENRFYTYKMLFTEVCKFVDVLKRFNLRKGDTLALYVPNLPEAVIAILACMRLGVIYSTIFSGFSSEGALNRLRIFKPKILITCDATYRRGNLVPLKSTLDAMIEEIDSIKAIVVINRAGQDINLKKGRDYWWNELMSEAREDYFIEPMEANEIGYVNFTSGTGGKPKGSTYASMGFAVQTAFYMKIQLNAFPEDIYWTCTDIGWLSFHYAGLWGVLLNGLTFGFQEGALDRPPDRLYRIISKYKVNKVLCPPTGVRMLMGYGEKIMEPYDLSRVDTFLSMGEMLDKNTWYWIYEKIGKEKIFINNSWGIGEMGTCFVMNASWLTPMKPGSVDIPILADVAVLDNEGNKVIGRPGALVLKTPLPGASHTLWGEHERYITEYFSQYKGWCYTGDLGVEDQDGHFWILGRMDDVINVAGHRVSPGEVEDAITKVKGVVEAAVVAKHDPLKVVVPAAFVVLEKNAQNTLEIKDQIRNQVIVSIGKFAALSDIYFVEKLPKTISGKILRRVLKEIASEGDIRTDITSIDDPDTIEYIKKAVQS